MSKVLSAKELLLLKIKAITTKPRNDALWARYFAELAKRNAYGANMPKPDLKKRLEFIISEAAKIEDTAEREEFKRGAMAGLFSDLAAYRKANPKPKSIAAKVLSGIGKGWQISGNLIKSGLAFGIKMAGSVAMIGLAPFIPAFKGMLQAVTNFIPDNIEDMVKDVYYKVLGKQSFDCYDGNGNYSIPRHQKLYLSDVAQSTMIAAITTYITTLKNKALKDPKTLTSSEKKIYGLVVKGEKEVHEMAKEQIALTLGEKFIKYRTPIIATGVALLLAIGATIAYKTSKKAS